jgi:hypothetical protein
LRAGSLDQLRDHVRHGRFEEAARAVNDRYRVASGEILGVFEKMVTVLCQPSFSHDLKNVRSFLRLGRPSLRSLLREFIHAGHNQNCLTAVLRNLEEDVPDQVRMGFAGVSSFLGKTDYAFTYQSDIVDYEPDFSRLTDNRLVRLLSSPPNTVDLALFDERATAKKDDLIDSFQRESLEPVKDVFLAVLQKCDDFFTHLEDFARDFAHFFERFREKHFIADDRTATEWQELGSEYFHLEVLKSSLMLPISPKALYWGMQQEYPLTLEKLKELYAIVTPEIEISDGETVEREWTVGVTCRNPESVREDSLVLEPTFHLVPAGMDGRSSFGTEITVVEPNRSYRCRFTRKGDGGVQLSLTMKVACEAKCYPLPFVKEKTFHLS